MADETPETPSIKYKRIENFISAYANNVILESSTWDLKLVCGQLDQSSTPNTVAQNVAVTLPWPQAKLLAFYLRLHVEAEEIADGKIHIRPDLVPAEPPPPTPEQESDPNLKRFYDFMVKLREEFIANL